MIRVAPSLLAADLLNLGEALDSVVDAGLSSVHVDVMDGRFVPNISFGVNMAQAVKRHGALKFDCHLMVEEPERYVESYAKTGTELITVHLEATYHLHRLIYRIRELGCKAGVAINPATSPVLLEPVLSDLDVVLVMSVNPGFGGQSFIESQLAKIAWLDQARRERGFGFEIQVDGGINLDNARKCIEQGATYLVAGASFFGSQDRKEFAYQLMNAGV